jgi:predicted RNA methylase
LTPLLRSRVFIGEGFVVLDEGAKYCEKLAVTRTLRKNLGQYFTVEAVAASLVKWAVRRRTDRLLDPSCGDGQFIIHHKRSVGVELDPKNARIARERMPAALIHGGDFFSWATETKERFEAVAGNPPFISYQSFKASRGPGLLQPRISWALSSMA